MPATPRFASPRPATSKLTSRLSFGHVAGPGTYSTTVTRPDLFRNYLTQQIELLVRHHGQPVVIAASDTPIPVHFAVAGNPKVSVPQEGVLDFSLRDVFDVPDLATTNDDIVNGTRQFHPDGSRPLAPFTAQRVDYSLARLSHYTATDATHFQNHVLFTNYQFYVDEFESYARQVLADPAAGYTAFVAPGNHILTQPDGDLPTLIKMPQMPTYHLKRADGNGITLVNIGVGPSNAKTATDHIAVLRPHAWMMVGHCAGLRNSQSLGDFVLAHAYLREDHVLDDDLPIWVPIPALAEIQIALEDAVEEVTQLEGYELKRIMRTGTVATIDNRNWELRDQSGPVQRLSQSRAIALDMESATIAANGFRFPRALWHPSLRQRQTPPRRIETARHGVRVLQDTGRPPSPDRHPCHGTPARHAGRAHPQPETPQLRRDSLPLDSSSINRHVKHMNRAKWA